MKRPVIAITGHRPNRIPSEQYVSAQLRNSFIDLSAGHVIQGMADGVDLLAALAAQNAKIPFSCAIPWEGHKPGNGWEDAYHFALVYAENVWVVNDCQGYPGPQVYQERNEYMVDRCHILVAVWDFQKKGGTWNTVKYAISKRIPIWRIDPSGDTESGWYEYK